MVDRIEKLDPKLYRVQESREDRERRQKQEQEGEEREPEKDEFDQGKKPFWKKLIPDAAANPVGVRPTWKLPEATGVPGERFREEQSGDPSVSTETKEESLTLSRRVLVLWGIIDLEGKPRFPVIVTYLVVVTVITVSTFLILGILWR